MIKNALGTGTAAATSSNHRSTERLQPGPSAEQRARGRAVVVAEVSEHNRSERSSSRLVTPEPYALTALTAVEIVQRIASDGAPAGFRTPSAVFGADFIMGFDGIGRVDL